MNDSAALVTAQPQSGCREIEVRLHITRRRYATAREQLARVREEYETLSMERDIHPELLDRAAIRVAAANAACLRIRRDIDAIEKFLECRKSTLSLRAALVR
jgi:hypothetical protein